MAKRNSSQLAGTISIIFTIGIILAAVSYAIVLTLSYFAFNEMQAGVNGYLATINAATGKTYAFSLLNFPNSLEMQFCIGLMTVFTVLFAYVCALAFYNKARRYVAQADIFYDEAPAAFVRSIEREFQESSHGSQQSTRDFITRLLECFDSREDLAYFVEGCRKEYDRSGQLKIFFKTFSDFQGVHLKHIIDEAGVPDCGEGV